MYLSLCALYPYSLSHTPYSPSQHLLVNLHTHTFIVNKQSQQLFIPHEFAYLNKSVLEGSYGYSAPATHKHFVLKKRPQASVQLRNEMLQRGVDHTLSLSLSLSLSLYLIPRIKKMYWLIFMYPKHTQIKFWACNEGRPKIVCII